MMARPSGLASHHKRWSFWRCCSPSGPLTHDWPRIATVGTLSVRDLPGVDRLLRDPRLGKLPRELAVQAAREVLEGARRGILDGGWAHALGDLPRLVEQRVHEATAPRLRPVL